jgi:hypothetical protein
MIFDGSGVVLPGPPRPRDFPNTSFLLLPFPFTSVSARRQDDREVFCTDAAGCHRQQHRRAFSDRDLIKV